MRTVGEILKQARTSKKLTFERIESRIKIRKKYLEALEENAWHKLPSLAYIKGFLKNYSNFLDLNSDEILAVFRREYKFEEKEEVIPSGISANLKASIVRLTPQSVFLIVGGLFLMIFFINLFFQYRAIISPPNLNVEKPLEGEILKSTSLVVSGKTDPDATLSINSKQIVLNEKGEFKETFNLLAGVNTIQIESVSKHGKKRTITRTVTVEEKEDVF